MDLFDEREGSKPGTRSAPLASRMRPLTLDEVVGQDHLLGPGKLLRRAIEADRLSSLILYGPPGCGKTSLAEVIARTTDRKFERTSGVLSNVAELRRFMEAAETRQTLQGKETILFIDEIHRFNKAQQDVLLPYVEQGSITLVGATTHNPFFFINSPLNSRSQIFQLEPLSQEAVAELLTRSVTHPRGLAPYNPKVEMGAIDHLALVCDGDARRALNALELAVLTTPPDKKGQVHITAREAEESIQKKAVVYDHDEDGHYDTISAFIKSIRGCDPNAAIYWLAKMLYAGEDPRFIARRLVILASEDIGNADPRGLALAVSAMEAVDFVGMPEARIILAQATTYLASAPKSNASYKALENATTDVKEGRTLPVPKHLRGSTYSGAEKLGHTGYQYSHNHPDHFVDQEYVPTDKIYYEPDGQGYEETIKNRLAYWQSLKESSRNQKP